MKNFFYKLGGSVASLAIMLTALNVNSACWLHWNQEKLPENAQKLRKF